MSILPEIPSNLLTTQETTERVVDLDTSTEQDLVGVDAVAVEDAVTSAATEAADAVLQEQLSKVNAAKQQVLEKLFPASLFALTSIELIESKVNVKIAKYALAVSILLKIPATSKLAEDLVSPAEIKEYIAEKIDAIKRKRQEAIIKLQKQKAKLEETPFTARADIENNQL